eukprot:TRINITY_DN3091_c0_g1_i4.p1 TRINITY_DN3091_c0_g1~~TRINITY_DN3091_c0_g1_i4.p1  ORF type:complete len:390 (-),score=86.96 TRINITY_DN3091_c0_g1_i4:220-1389(-)
MRLAQRLASLVLLLSATFPASFAASLPLPLASLHGDPHFKGADGINFRFTGELGNTYCLLTEPLLHINIQLQGFQSLDGKDNLVTRTWVKALGVLVGKHQLSMVARSGGDVSIGSGYLSSIRLNDREIQLPPGSKIVSADGALTVQHLVQEEGSDENVQSFLLATASGAEILAKLQPEEEARRKAEDALIHFNVDVLKAGVLREPHGVMGQTFRSSQREQVFRFATKWNPELEVWEVSGPNGDEYLDGTVTDYQTSGLLQPDCKVSKFGTEEETAAEVEAKQWSDEVDNPWEAEDDASSTSNTDDTVSTDASSSSDVDPMPVPLEDKPAIQLMEVMQGTKEAEGEDEGEEQKSSIQIIGEMQGTVEAAEGGVPAAAGQVKTVTSRRLLG